MKYIITITSLFSICFAQTDHHYIFSPGIKLGYVFGSNGGIVFGFEGSLIVTGDYNDDPVYGIVFNYDWLGKTEFLHIGLEYSENATGIEVGPTFGWLDGDRHFGFGVTPYAGFLIYPYYNYTYLNNGTDFHQIGSFAKLPIQIDDRRYNWSRSRERAY